MSKKSTDRPHYKLHRTKKRTEFHPLLPTIHKTLPSKMSFSKISKFFAMIPKLNTYFLYHHSFYSNDKNLGNFLVRSAFKFNNQPGTFTCKRTRCTTCSFISNTVKISGHNRSDKVTDHFTCISTNVIYCIICTLCTKIYIGETGRRLADRFREHLRDAEQNNTDASKPVARHFNLPNHSHHNLTICALSLHPGNTESRKNVEQKFIFQLGTLSPHGIDFR